MAGWAAGLVLCWLLGALGTRGAPPGMDAEMAELAGMVRAECATDSGVELARVEAVNAGGTLASLADDAALACYIKCTMETAGMLADGEVDLEAVLALLPAELRRRNEAALRACGTVRGRDACDTAFRTQVCWQQANPQDYFLI